MSVSARPRGRTQSACGKLDSTFLDLGVQCTIFIYMYTIELYHGSRRLTPGSRYKRPLPLLFFYLTPFILPWCR